MTMARASSWATGQAWAWQSMALDQRDELLVTFIDARRAEGEEAEDTLLSGLATTIQAILPRQSKQASGNDKTIGMKPPKKMDEPTKSRNRVYDSRLPAKLDTCLDPGRIFED